MKTLAPPPKQKPCITCTFTINEKVMLCAQDLPSPFSIQSLAVAAWERWPEEFGLTGFEKIHPNCNTVICTVCGKKGLKARGWLEKRGPNLYAVTKEGLVSILLFTLQEEIVEMNVPRLALRHERLLKALFESVAVQKFEKSRQHELTFMDACHFWAIIGVNDLKKIDAISKWLIELENIEGSLSNGRIIKAPDIRFLNNMHRYLEDRFERHLTLMRNRKVKK